MRYILYAVVLSIAILASTAVWSIPSNGTWVCSGIPKGEITKDDLINFYSGNKYKHNGKWVKLYMLPVNHPLTNEMMGSLGISPSAVAKRLAANSLVESGLRMVATPDTVLIEMEKDKPSIGYVDGNWSKEVHSCF